MIKTIIVDDQPLVRAGFRMILAAQPDIELVGEAEDGSQALALTKTLTAQGHPPDIIVMDIRMPVMNGVEATQHLNTLDNPPRIIVLTTFDTDEDAFASLQAGASGFLLKNSPPEDLLAAIRTVARGDAVVAPSVTRRLLEHFAGRFTTPAARRDPRLDQLTDREREVVVLIAQGLSNVEIASQLVVAEATVKTHVGRILTKLDLRDRVQIAVFAYQSGLVNPT